MLFLIKLSFKVLGNLALYTRIIKSPKIYRDSWEWLDNYSLTSAHIYKKALVEEEKKSRGIILFSQTTTACFCHTEIPRLKTETKRKKRLNNSNASLVTVPKLGSFLGTRSQRLAETPADASVCTSDAELGSLRSVWTGCGGSSWMHRGWRLQT